MFLRAGCFVDLGFGGESNTESLQSVYHIERWCSKKWGTQSFEMGIVQWLQVFLKSRNLSQYRQYYPLLQHVD
jgi:hypothetical protein